MSAVTGPSQAELRARIDDLNKQGVLRAAGLSEPMLKQLPPADQEAYRRSLEWTSPAELERARERLVAELSNTRAQAGGLR